MLSPQVKRVKLVELQKLFVSDTFTEEAKHRIGTEASLADTAAAAAEAEAEAVGQWMQEASSPWLEAETLSETSKRIGAASIPTAMLPTVLATMLRGLPEAAQKAAMERAAAAVQPLQVHLQPPLERGELVRKAVETLVVEATHWMRLKQARMARSLTDAAEARAQAATAVSHTVVSRAPGGQAQPSELMAVDSRSSEIVVEFQMGAAIKHLARRVKDMVAGPDEDTGHVSQSTTPTDSAIREVVAATIKNVEDAAAEAQKHAVAVAVSDARRTWEGLREAERRVELERSEVTFADAIQSSIDGKQKLLQDRIEQAVSEAEARLQSKHDTEMVVRMRAAVSSTREACEADAVVKMKTAVQEAFERGKAAVSMQADRAMVLRARKEALEMARREVSSELTEAKANETAAKVQLAKAKEDLEMVKVGTKAAAAVAVSKAAPMQRQARRGPRTTRMHHIYAPHICTTHISLPHTHQHRVTCDQKLHSSRSSDTLSAPRTALVYVHMTYDCTRLHASASSVASLILPAFVHPATTLRGPHFASLPPNCNRIAHTCRCTYG